MIQRFSEQPYKDEYAASLSQWQEASKTYYENVDPKVVSMLNADRELRGINRKYRKAKLVVQDQDKKPLVPFFR